ncbi:ATP-binding protein [Sphingomonas oligophenolica]|uniref:histidine kinase n=1 Tax=Sphingomonas oligophenolica TaxID=301154 RepID=A0A502C1A6_9SPHN|nr:ATP-binding protein [Sphingomonas oligophenolica]TPG06563.1 sensor histidine kinase [Sphingomonas oligophenolica]
MIAGTPVAAQVPVPVQVGDRAGHDNMLQLVQLRWLAVAGQLATILLTQFAFGIALPLVAMLGVLAGLVMLNLASIALMRRRRTITNGELFGALLLDVAALSAQLYFSGGATNPFVSLFLLQVVLGSVLLARWSSWALVVATSFAFALLTAIYCPIVLPAGFDRSLFALHIQGMWVCFALVAVLLVMFVTRINGNLRAQDAHLVAIRRQADEEEHIVRIGMLASGAAHELGTPLSSLSVILGDWRRIDAIARDPDLVRDVEEMQAEVQRCKAIVTSILLSSGDARGEQSAATTVRALFDRVVADWAAARDFVHARYHDAFGPDVPIASDVVLQQAVFNLLDNAAEVSPGGIDITLARIDDSLTLSVRDEGSGFAPDQLANLGKPYNSSKVELGRGLGLFLVGNVARKLGGTLAAHNLSDGTGAEVTLRLPLVAISLADDHG